MTIFELRDERYVVVSLCLEDPPKGPGGLTAGERAVAKLVTEGRTNAEIAVERGTSARTVANQMGAILRKLGASSRAHLARYSFAWPDAHLGSERRPKHAQ